MKRITPCSFVWGEVVGTNDPELLAFNLFSHKPYLLGLLLKGSMCDCMEYEYEEMATEAEVKEPLKIAVPVQVSRPKKR
jgi:hypothetical protein